MNDLLSIIVPIYNTEKYLKACIDSILDSTYTNFELILVNDGSTDSSYEICQSYNDERIVIINKENGGLSDARNAGMRCARGKFFLFIDSDDVIHRRLIELLFDEMIKSGADISTCDICYLYDEKDEEGFRKIDAPVNYERMLIQGDDKIRFLLKGLQTQLTMAQYKIFNRDLWTNVEFPYKKIHEDEFTAYKILNLANKVIYINAELYGYRQQNQSITHVYKLQSILDKIEAKEEIFNFVITQKYEMQIKSRAMFLLLRVIQKSYCTVYEHEPENMSVLNALKLKHSQYFTHNKELIKYMSLYEKIMVYTFNYTKGVNIWFNKIIKIIFGGRVR